MTVSRACYVTRDQVCKAADIKFSASVYDAVDRAIESASENIDQFTNRRFYTASETNRWDWPNFQHTYPWRLWLNQNELAGTPSLVTTGSLNQSPTTIPSTSYVLWPYNGPPFTRLDLRLDKSAAFGANSTPQQDIAITGLFGFWDRRKAAGALAAAFNDTTSTTITVTNGNLIGTGDVLIVESERMLVTDKTMVTTSQAWTGITTDSAADNQVGVPDGTLFFVGETILANAERMLIVDISGNTLVVKRGYDGTVLATHSPGTLFANRKLTVTRGDFGSTAATHLIGSVPVTQLIPAPVRDLALAEAVVQVIDEVGAYASTHGGDGGGSGYGGSLPDRWEEVETGFSRKSRIRAI